MKGFFINGATPSSFFHLHVYCHLIVQIAICMQMKEITISNNQGKNMLVVSVYCFLTYHIHKEVRFVGFHRFAECEEINGNGFDRLFVNLY